MGISFSAMRKIRAREYLQQFERAYPIFEPGIEKYVTRKAGLVYAFDHGIFNQFSGMAVARGEYSEQILSLPEAIS